MITGWIALSCIVVVVVVAPIHLGLWLPLADRRLNWEASPRRMSLRAARLVFIATLGLHLVWTLLSGIASTQTAGKLVGLIAANVLLAPFFFTASYGVWLHWRILRHPNRQASLMGAEPAEKDSELPSVAVVIACRNEPTEVVQMTLKSALNLKYPRQKLSFIIADNSDEDHPDFLELCADVEARQRRGEPIELLHRHGTQGFKAGNLDMALQATCSDLLLFLDVDNTVPTDLLLIHAAALWRDPGSSFHQCLHIACNGHASLLAATAGCVVGYGKYHDLALATFSDWSFFQGHACIWKRQALLRAAPVSQYLNSQSILAEDLYVSFRASRLGMHGHTYWTPSAYWTPANLDSLEKMLERWHKGALQCYAKDIYFILSRSMGYNSAGEYITLWYRLGQPFMLWLIPILAVLLPFSRGGAAVIAGLWAITGLLPPLLVMGLKSDANIGGVPCSPIDLLKQHLLYLFLAWSHGRAVMLFAFGSGAGWSPTPKVVMGAASQTSWLDACSRFQPALLFSLLASGLALAWKGLLFGESLLSPATLPVLYLATGIIAAIVLFAPLRKAPAFDRKRQPLLPSWMGHTAMRNSQDAPRRRSERSVEAEGEQLITRAANTASQS